MTSVHVSPVATGGIGGLTPPNKAPSPPKWNMKHYKLAEFLWNANVKPPCTNVKPPYWRLFGDGSDACDAEEKKENILSTNI